MMEVLWVSLFGAAFAWLQSRSDAEDQPDASVLVETEVEWTRWEEEIHDWRES